MGNKPNNYELRIIYSEILKGSSKFTLDSDIIYIKHPSNNEDYKMDEKRLELTQQALKNSIPYEEDKLSFLIENNLWSTKQEQEIKNEKFFLENLYKTKGKLYKKMELDQVTKNIDNSKAKISIMESHRQEVMGLTVENFVDSRLQHYYLLYSLYSDPEFQNPYLTEGEYNDMGDSEIIKLFKGYNSVFVRFSPINVKYIAISPFFVEGFVICDHDPVKYYGKPVVHLTALQIRLFHLGDFFHNIFKEGGDKIPADYRDDPEKLEEWYSASDARKDIMDKTNSDGVGVVISDKEDAKKLGIENKGEMNMSKAVKNSNKKSLSFQEIIKMQDKKV